MKTFRLIGFISAMAVSVAVAAQQAEYWLDADPGFGHGVAVVVVGENASATVATASLQPGVHTLGVRAKQGSKWGQTYTHRFYVLTAPNTVISGAEWWLDTDPGHGLATAVAADAQTQQLVIPFSTTALAPGIHTLGVRMRQGNTWGQTYTHRFYVLTAPNTIISGAEWWLDADPGHGQATAVAADGTTQQLVIPFTTTGLTAGIHTLGVRMRQGDTWGQTYTHRFYVLTAPNTAISGAEWWLDADPGHGQATAVAADGTTQQLVIPFTTTGLTTGIHTLGVRMRQGDVWGQTYTHRFYVLTAPNTAISGAEWWLDTDPGHGQATAVAADGTTQQVVIPFTTTGLTTGIHTLGVRMRQGDIWGQTYTHRFMIIPDQVVSATIETVEASWDFDVEHAIAIPFTQEGDIVEISNHALSIDELSNGVHTLCICAQANGKWTIIAAYEVTKSENPTGLNGATEEVVTYKVLRNDQVLIIRAGQTYTLQGVPVR